MPFVVVAFVLCFCSWCRKEVNKLRTLQYNLDARLDHVRLQAMVG